MNNFNVNKIHIDTDNIVKKLFLLKPYWELRSELYPFYTLGKSSYIDGDNLSYKNEYKKYNEILINEFSDLINNIIDYLKNYYNENVILTNDLAYPGFHIFQSDFSFNGISGSWHLDLPHIKLGIDGTDNSTVTVVIKIPQSGAGLDWLDSNGVQQYLPYEEKDIITHNGMTPHRIAKLNKIVDNEYRITMQGHLIRRNKILELYW